MTKTEAHNSNGTEYTPPLHPIGEMYERQALDCIIDLVDAISQDYLERPTAYREVSTETVNIIADFINLKESSDWLDASKRFKIYGKRMRDGCAVASSLRRAAIIFSEQSGGKGEHILRQAFIDELVMLRANLKMLEGGEVSIADRKIKAIFEKATEVLRSREVCHLFYPITVSEGDWPLGGAFSAIGAKLIEEIATRLKKDFTGGRILQSLTQQKFINLQRTGYYAKLTISGVLDDSEGWDSIDRVDNLILYTYRWAKMEQVLMQSLRLLIIRAWKDPEFRQGLSDFEQALVPEHPAGKIELTAASPDAMQASQTFTISDMWCCCDSVYLCGSEILACPTENCEKWIKH